MADRAVPQNFFAIEERLATNLPTYLRKREESNVC